MFDVGIAEEHAVTFSGGMATQGMKPIAAIYSTFLQRAFDQVFHDVAIMDLPVVFALDRAGIAGQDGPTHHGIYDMAYLRVFPNMVCMAPKDENELRHMLKTAFETGHPTSLRYPRGNGVGVTMDAGAAVAADRQGRSDARRRRPRRSSPSATKCGRR